MPLEGDRRVEPGDAVGGRVAVARPPRQVMVMEGEEKDPAENSEVFGDDRSSPNFKLQASDLQPMSSTLEKNKQLECKWEDDGRRGNTPYMESRA